MSVMHAWTRFLSMFRARGLDREFDDEARSHLALATEDYVQRGMPLAEAQRLARVKFGSMAASKDVYRDSRGLPSLEGLFQDARFALRGLRRDWAFSLTAIVTLAVAIGLNVTVFTVREAMLFRGNPLARRSDRLVYLAMRKPSDLQCCPGPVSYVDFEAWRAQAQAFEGLAFEGGGGPVTFRNGNGRPLDTAVSRVSANTFSLLGVRPMLGRDFVPADEAPGASSVVILSYHFWESPLDKRADIVGSTVHINGAPVTVIGVMPEGFVIVYERNLWMPLVQTPVLEGSVFGRLRNGATLQGARAQLEAINRRLTTVDPAKDRDVVVSARTYTQAYMSPDAPMIYGSLWVGAWFVMLIACANLANLTLARTMGRWRDFSTRMALGAGQWRMMRQMLLESLMLAGIAGALGWWITGWSVRTWAEETASRYLALEYTLNASILAYLVAISVAAAILCSLAPIVRVVQLGVSGALKGDARGVTQGLRGKHVGAVLVAAQMALAIVLLSGAGVLVTRLRYFDRLEARLKTIPGIQEVSVASSIPVMYGNTRTLEIEGRPSPPVGEERVQFLSVGSNYFRVVGVSAIAGRDFNDGDRMAALPVAIVNQSFAATFWPGEQPLGRRLRTTNRNQTSEWRTVVGVMPNIQQGDPLRQQFKPLVYVPFRQEPAAPATKSGNTGFRGANFLLRTSVPPDHVAQLVQAEVHNIDPDVLLEDFGTLRDSFVFDRDRMDLEHAELGKHAAVAPILALIALSLAAIGLYSVIAHSVSQRTKEIGVRIAIGAASHDIRRLIFGEGMRPVAFGLIVGLTVSLAVNRILQSQLVGVSPYDPVTLVTAPAVLILVALLACQIPSRCALRVDPAVALRHEA
jgi:putative ABC transport system permease protein